MWYNYKSKRWLPDIKAPSETLAQLAKVKDASESNANATSQGDQTEVSERKLKLANATKAINGAIEGLLAQM